MKRLLISAGLAVLALSACGDKDGVLETGSANAVESAVEPATPITESLSSSVSTSDFDVSMFITENECYNSAGALITAEPDLTYIGTEDIDGREFTIVFDVTGGGMRQTGSVELHADGQYSYGSEMYDTPTCVSTLTATVTDVRER
jgi:hypothetical protein